MTVEQTSQYGLQVGYTEPSVDSQGQPLTDLKEVAVELVVDGTRFWTLVNPASSPTGGQPRRVHFAIEPNPEKAVTIQVTATAIGQSGSRSKSLVHTKTLTWVAPGEVT